MTEPTYTVAELLSILEGAVTEATPGEIWVRGEIAGFRRTSGGAAFFRLADAETDDVALEVSARGRVMHDVDDILDSAGIGPLRDGVEVRVSGTVALDRRRSVIRLSLLEVDPAFTAGRLATVRAGVLRRMSSDGSIAANHRLEIPLVPLHIGLVTSRGSAAHADFLEHLRRTSFHFSVKTAHTRVQGETAAPDVADAIERVGREPVDIIALIRGGGSRLDLSVFDTEIVGRAIASSPVPVVTGIGHEIDRTVADEAGAVHQKTPTAAGAWIVSRVEDFADRIDGAGVHIAREARGAMTDMGAELRGVATGLSNAREVLGRQQDRLAQQADIVSTSARDVLVTQKRHLESLAEWFSTIGVEATLDRGFALVTRPHEETVLRSVTQVSVGDRLLVRMSDGVIGVTVSGEET